VSQERVTPPVAAIAGVMLGWLAGVITALLIVSR
jgi:hypothetical protein